MQHVARVVCSSVGWLVFYFALCFGIRVHGVEIVAPLVNIAQRAQRSAFRRRECAFAA